MRVWIGGAGGSAEGADCVNRKRNAKLAAQQAQQNDDALVVAHAFEEPDLINGLNGFSEAEMEAFLQATNPS